MPPTENSNVYDVMIMVFDFIQLFYDNCTVNERYLNREADITNQDKIFFFYSNQNQVATTE